MDVKSFIGKVVISRSSKKRFTLYEIAASQIMVRTERPNGNGCCSFYSWETINGDPISKGELFFEDETLKQPFIDAYEAYSYSEDARWENYGYWMRKD